MKNLMISAIVSVFILTACNSAKQASTGNNYDDVYYSSKNKPAAPAPAENSNQNIPEQSPQPANNESSRFDYANDNNSGNSGSAPESSYTTQGKDGNTYVTNNYYNNDDYYDYAYTSRIRRFYNPTGYGYYDPYYTNSYWYDYNPYSWGVSIYSTYSWWAPAAYYNYNPYYGNSWGISFSYGVPWNPYIYRPYYYPYGYNSCGCGSGYGYGYSPYSSGYNNGYWDGYYTGLYSNAYSPYYYNSYDNVSHYYGYHHNTTGSSGAGTPNPHWQGRSSTLNNNLASTYVNAVEASVSMPHNPTIPIRESSLNSNTIKSGSVSSASDNITGGVKSAPVRNENVGTINSDVKNPDVKSNSYSDIKTESQGDIKNSGNIKNNYSTQPGTAGNVKGNNPHDVKTNNTLPDVRNNYSGPGNDYNATDNNGGVKQPYNNTHDIGNSNPRVAGSDYGTPGSEIKNNGGDIKHEAPVNSGTGKSKWNGVFNSGNSEHNTSGDNNHPQYSEPKKGKHSDYSQPRNDTPKQNSQPSYQQPRNTQPAPRQESKGSNSRPRESKR